MTPHQRADSVKAKHGARYDRLMREAQTLINLPRNLDNRANRMLAITDEIAGMVAPSSPCKKGCSYCCYQAVIISDWEADRIAKQVKRKITDFIGYEPEEGGRDKMVQKYMGKPCPFLKANVCSIYEVRPFACRLHYSVAEDALNCDIISQVGARVPYFNFQNLEQLLAYLFVGDNCKFGDIREFFPMGEQSGHE